jgi:hypothetical protein
MKVRNVALRVGDVVDRLADPAAWLGAAAAFVIVAYILTAPPVLLAHARQTGNATFPAAYWPILRLIESDFGGPIVWYFNSVWGAGLMLIGSDEGPPWYILASYAVLGGALVSAMGLPFWKAWRRRRVM